MDYKQFNRTQMVDAIETLTVIDGAMSAHPMPDGFQEYLAEFVSAKPDERSGIINEMTTYFQILTFAEANGNPDMADALMKVADDMAKMDTKSLNDIAKNGLQKVAEK